MPSAAAAPALLSPVTEAPGPFHAVTSLADQTPAVHTSQNAGSPRPDSQAPLAGNMIWTTCMARGTALVRSSNTRDEIGSLGPAAAKALLHCLRNTKPAD